MTRATDHSIMNQWVGFVLLLTFLLAPSASAGIFSHKNKGPQTDVRKTNYKTKYIAKKYKSKKQKNPYAKLAPKGTHPPTR